MSKESNDVKILWGCGRVRSLPGPQGIAYITEDRWFTSFTLGPLGENTVENHLLDFLKKDFRGALDFMVSQSIHLDYARHDGICGIYIMESVYPVLAAICKSSRLSSSKEVRIISFEQDPDPNAMGCFGSNYSTDK